MQKLDLKEKCGVIALWDGSSNAAYLARLSLAALQHRGLESAGISIYTPKNKIVTYKGMGLVPHVITDSVIADLGLSKQAIGQNRYGTSGESSFANAQPIDIKHKKFQLALGHNGNLPDVTKLRRRLGESKNVTSDTYLMSEMLVKERNSFKNWEDTLVHTLPYFDGAYNLVILTEEGSIFGARDPFGIRPLCLGKLPQGWIIASESVALDTIGAEFVRDVAPGEIIKIDKNGNLSSYFFGIPKRHQFCIFEYIYFARPDSFMNGRRVKAGRERSGMFLGERIKDKKLKPDIVIPVFDSGYPAAKGVAKELGLPLVDAITTSHYIGRTFIQPGQEKRVAAVGGKHNVVADEVTDKKIVVVDDSAVRLTTSIVLARELKKAGAKEIYMAFASPPVVEQCDLGIDMRNKKDLPAAKFKNNPIEVIEKEVANIIDINEVIYLPIDKTAEAMGGKKEDFYYSPFGGPHPIRDKQIPLPLRSKKIIGKPKIAVFASGVSKGKNLGKIIDSIENGYIEAKISNVLANTPDSPSITRSKNHSIPTTIIPFLGKFSNVIDRKNYEIKLVKHIQRIKPDLLLLSGWDFVLSDFFVKKLQDLQIPIINHHPALLPTDDSDTVQTSKGKIKVVRGNNKFKASFENPSLVSGLSVHQILPGNFYDVGPIVMKAEVRKRPDDTLETWEERNREMEYLLLPTAMKRVLHVMKNNIDISKGEFVW